VKIKFGASQTEVFFNPAVFFIISCDIFQSEKLKALLSYS